MPSSSNKRIAKNTIYLYIRKILTIAINIYASRLLLQTLGFDDYGLYGLVGSVIVMFSSLRSLFTSSIQRYINTAKGDDSADRVNEIFNIGLKIHIFISIIFFIAVEIGGFVMIPNLNIPSGSVSAAYWILQFSILSSIASIMTVPYDAVIIANERFNAYALLSVVETILKLGIVFALVALPFNRVITYSCLLFLVQLSLRFANAYYCKLHFSNEVKIRNANNRKLLKEMGSFAGWQFFGNFAITSSEAGTNFVLNIFGGVIANAASGITSQILGVIQSFTSDLSTSFNPQITQNFKHNRSRSFSLAFFNSKISTIVSLCIAYPFLCNSNEVLSLWLGEVPEYTNVFVRVIMLYVVVRCVHSPLDVLFKAYGKIKEYQITELIVLLSNVPISWIALKLGCPLYSVFIVMATLELVNLLLILCLAHRQFGLDITLYFKEILLRLTLASLVLTGCYVFYSTEINIGTSVWLFLASVASNVLIAFIVSSLIILSKEEYTKVFSLLSNHKTS